MNDEKQTKSFSLGSVLGLIICSFFTIIMIFSMVVVMNIKRFDACVPMLVFVFFNLIIITPVVTYGKAITKALSFPVFIQIAFVTFAYSLFQFIHMFLTIDTANAAWYTLYHLCVLFGYFVVVTPIALMGIHNKKSN